MNIKSAKSSSSRWLARVSRVLIFTMLCSTFMHQGWYKPKMAEAAISELKAWSSVYHGTATTAQTIVYSVPAGSGTNRVLVVAISSSQTAVGARTVTLTYGGQTFTSVIGDMATATIQQHSQLYYLKESGLDAATNTNLVVTVSGGTTRMTDVFAAVYDGVDQAAPITNSRTYNSGTTAVSTFAFATALTVNAGDQAVEIINCTRLASATPRTITYATNWTMQQEQTSTVIDAIRNAVAERSIPSTNTTDTSSTTFNNTALASMSGMSLKAALVDLTVGDGTNPSSGSAPQGSTGKALDAFTLAMRTGTATVSTLTLTGGAQFTNANVSAIKIYRDNGTIGALDGADVLVNTTTAWALNVATVTFTTPESVSTTAGNYLVVIDVAAAATVGNVLSGTITAATGTGLGFIDFQDTASATLTVKTSGLSVGNGMNPANAGAPQASLKNAMNAFTLDMGVGSGTVNTLTLTGSTQFTSANVSAIRLYRDKGAIGILDNSDAQAATSTAWAANVATITISTPEPVTTTSANYLVVVDVATGATVANTLSGTITAATGTGLGTVVYADSSSGTLTVAAGGALTIDNGTNPAVANTPVGSYDNALDAFTTVLSAGKGQLTVLTLTGSSANFSTTNIGNIKIFADSAPLGTLNGSDMLIPTTYTHVGAVATITFANPEPVTTTVRNYLVVVDIKPGATVGQLFSATITTPATGSGYIGSPTFSDAANNMTIAKATAVNSSCTGCHGYSSASVTGVFYDGTSRNTPTGAFVGSHATHVGEYGKACSVCHTAPATETSADYNHRDGNIQMATNINGDTGGSYGAVSTWTQTNTPTFQSCSSVYCHSQGVSKTSQTGDDRSLSSPPATLVWGSSGTCESCHGNPPNYANGATTWGGTAKANSHSSHTTQCQTCHNATTTTGDAITDATKHTNKSYDIASGPGATIGSYAYAAAGGTCNNISCHGGRNDQWGTTVTCVDCHTSTVLITKGPLANGTNARRAVAAEFKNTWSHKRSTSGGVPANTVVTKYDCIVCHMEGTMATGKTDPSYHANGYIELRNPDTGVQIEGVTFSGGTGTNPGSYTSTGVALSFDRFSRNLGNANLETAVTAIQVNQCLKCHDADGAKSIEARVPGGTAEKPFGTTIAGARYVGAGVTANGVLGGVTDVNASFATTNSSYHPVSGKQNNWYAKLTRMVTPWNAATRGGTVDVTSWGPLISCWDCHALTTDTGTITQTVTAHGAAQTMRGNPTVPNGAAAPAAGTNEATLCKICHAGYDTSTSATHGANSAFSSTANNGMTTTMRYGCNMCHSSGYDTPVVRPVRAIDVHGVNVLPTATVTLSSRWSTGTDKRPYAFIRNTTYLGNHQPANIAGTAYSPGCDMAGSSGAAGQCNNQGPDVYTAGGTY